MRPIIIIIIIIIIVIVVMIIIIMNRFAFIFEAMVQYAGAEEKLVIHLTTKEQGSETERNSLGMSRRLQGEHFRRYSK